jgi:hypothetical protein
MPKEQNQIAEAPKEAEKPKLPHTGGLLGGLAAEAAAKAAQRGQKPPPRK